MGFDLKQAQFEDLKQSDRPSAYDDRIGFDWTVGGGMGVDPLGLG